MKRGASLTSETKGYGNSRHLIISNVGWSDAAGVRYQLLNGEQDVSHWLGGEKPEILSVGQWTRLEVSQETGPQAVKLVLTWTAEDNESRRFIGVVTRW